MMLRTTVDLIQMRNSKCNVLQVSIFTNTRLIYENIYIALYYNDSYVFNACLHPFLTYEKLKLTIQSRDWFTNVKQFDTEEYRKQLLDIALDIYPMLIVLKTGI